MSEGNLNNINTEKPVSAGFCRFLFSLEFIEKNSRLGVKNESSNIGRRLWNTYQ